ncbi:hypothetical protein SSBR45G_15760 [Bradyrhizobium sp. SSBR45G]|nr:hypothetical protein SSBR45G_15760 [Bradyrhizobium sp. SSBR45G]
MQRSTRAVHITDVGSAFYNHCDAMTEAARAALDVARSAHERPSGRLRVSCPVGVAHIFLSPILPRFLLVNPNVRLELELTNRRVDVIGEGYDVALRVRTALDDSNLVVRSFGISHQVLAASPSFVEKYGPFDTVASLRGVHGLGPAEPTNDRPRWRLTAPDGDPVEIEYTSALVTDDVYMLSRTALAGAGVAQLPFNLCADAIEDGRLIVLLPDHSVPAHQLHAVFASKRGLVPALRAFIEFLASELTAATADANSRYDGIHRGRRD